MGRPWQRVAAAMAAAGWGANQFASMLLAYRAERGLSEQLVTGMFAAYVAGLVPALLGAAWLSQHHGKRPLVRVSVVLMLLGSALLLAGADSPVLLFAGRIVSGVGIGCAMGPGTAWVKELSTDAPAGTGARRSTIALTAGFALGPLVAGVAAQWLPAPLHLPYVLHLAFQAAVGVAVWNVAEPDAGDHPTPTVRELVRHLARGWFVRVVLPAMPWVFGCATVAFAVVPSALGPLPGLPRIAAAGLSAGLTLGTSVLVQPRVRHLARTNPTRVLMAGMAVAALGMGLAALAAAWPHVLWLPLVAVVLGVGHGLLFVGGLTQVELHTPQHLMAASSAVAYVLAYIGFTAPYPIALLSLVVPVWTTLVFGAVLAALTAGWLALQRD